MIIFVFSQIPHIFCTILSILFPMRIILSSPESRNPRKMGRKLLRYIHFETDPSLRVVSKTIRKKQFKMLQSIKYKRRPGKRKKNVLIETANKLDHVLNKIRVWEDKFDSKHQ